MMFRIDERIDLARRRQFAGELRALPLGQIEHLRGSISGAETEEFYAGLLAGLTAATTLIQGGLVDTVPHATAAIADLCESKEFAA